MSFAILAGGFQALLGALVFGFLFAATFSLAMKVAIGAAFLLVVFLIERIDIQNTMFHEEMLGLVGALFEAMDHQSSGNKEGRPSEYFHAQRNRRRLEFVLGGEGWPFFAVHFAQYAAWILLGWLLAEFELIGRLDTFFGATG